MVHRLQKAGKRLPNVDTEPKFYQMPFLPEIPAFRHQKTMPTSECKVTSANGGTTNPSQSPIASSAHGLRAAANNLPSIPNYQATGASANLNLQQLQAQISHPVDIWAAQTLLQNAINLQALQALQNVPFQLPGATANLSNLSSLAMAGLQSVDPIPQHVNTSFQLPWSSAGLPNPSNVSFPSLLPATGEWQSPYDIRSQLQRCGFNGAFAPRNDAHPLQQLNIPGSSQDRSLNLNNIMPAAQPRSDSHRDATISDGKDMRSQGNDNSNGCLSDLQRLGALTQLEGINPSTAQLPASTSHVAAASSRLSNQLDLRQQSDALLGNSPNNALFQEFARNYLSLLGSSSGGESGSDEVKDQPQEPRKE